MPIDQYFGQQLAAPVGAQKLLSIIQDVHRNYGHLSTAEQHARVKAEIAIEASRLRRLRDLRGPVDESRRHGLL